MMKLLFKIVKNDSKTLKMSSQSKKFAERMTDFLNKQKMISPNQLKRQIGNPENLSDSLFKKKLKFATRNLSESNSNVPLPTSLFSALHPLLLISSKKQRQKEQSLGSQASLSNASTSKKNNQSPFKSISFRQKTVQKIDMSFSINNIDQKFKEKNKLSSSLIYPASNFPISKKKKNIKQKSLYTSYSKIAEIRYISVGLASSNVIRGWAEKKLPNGKILGEVTSANTLHHKTFKPLKGGLFCERIFGPLKDFECACGNIKRPTQEEYQKIIEHQKIERRFCPTCDVEYTWSIIRRYQMGFIHLVSPVTHIWYLKANPSYLSILLDFKKSQLEKIVYCSQTMTLENSWKIVQNFNISSSPSELFRSWQKILKSNDSSNTLFYSSDLFSASSVRKILEYQKRKNFVLQNKKTKMRNTQPISHEQEFQLILAKHFVPAKLVTDAVNSKTTQKSIFKKYKTLTNFISYMWKIFYKNAYKAAQQKTNQILKKYFHSIKNQEHDKRLIFNNETNLLNQNISLLKNLDSKKHKTSSSLMLYKEINQLLNTSVNGFFDQNLVPNFLSIFKPLILFKMQNTSLCNPAFSIKQLTENRYGNVSLWKIFKFLQQVECINLNFSCEKDIKKLIFSIINKNLESFPHLFLDKKNYPIKFSQPFLEGFWNNFSKQNKAMNKKTLLSCYLYTKNPSLKLIQVCFKKLLISLLQKQDKFIVFFTKKHLMSIISNSNQKMNKLTTYMSRELVKIILKYRLKKALLKNKAKAQLKTCSNSLFVETSKICINKKFTPVLGHSDSFFKPNLIAYCPKEKQLGFFFAYSQWHEPKDENSNFSLFEPSLLQRNSSVKLKSQNLVILGFLLLHFLKHEKQLKKFYTLYANQRQSSIGRKSFKNKTGWNDKHSLQFNNFFLFNLFLDKNVEIQKLYVQPFIQPLLYKEYLLNFLSLENFSNFFREQKANVYLEKNFYALRSPIMIRIMIDYSIFSTFKNDFQIIVTNVEKSQKMKLNIVNFSGWYKLFGIYKNSRKNSLLDLTQTHKSPDASLNLKELEDRNHLNSKSQINKNNKFLFIQKKPIFPKFRNGFLSKILKRKKIYWKFGYCFHNIVDKVIRDNTLMITKQEIEKNFFPKRSKNFISFFKKENNENGSFQKIFGINVKKMKLLLATSSMPNLYNLQVKTLAQQGKKELFFSIQRKFVRKFHVKTIKSKIIKIINIFFLKQKRQFFKNKFLSIKEETLLKDDRLLCLLISEKRQIYFLPNIGLKTDTSLFTDNSNYRLVNFNKLKISFLNLFAFLRRNLVRQKTDLLNTEKQLNLPKIDMTIGKDFNFLIAHKDLHRQQRSLYLTSKNKNQRKMKKEQQIRNPHKNHIYSLSYRELWDHERDWQYFSQYNLGPRDFEDFSIPIYNHEVFNSFSLSPTTGKNTSLFCLAGAAIIQKLLSEFHSDELKKIDKQSRLLLNELNKKIEISLMFVISEFAEKSEIKEFKQLCKKRDQVMHRTKFLRKIVLKKSNPNNMILNILPVLPPDLRPILKMQDQIAASDLNRLYQRIIYRNDRLKKFRKDPAMNYSFEVKYAQRLLQEAVDNLIQNGKGGVSAERDSRGRPLKSLSEILKGKQGRFRQYLLGKRVDYSGRSVIVVGPKLRIHECGLPKEIALELFLPFLIQRILHYKFARTVIGAKNVIKTNKNLTWYLLAELMQSHPIFLNRAPTLHRLGIQAFIPKLIDGRAILLHPLVCPAFNADFDGDQMAVHIPLTLEARAEAWKLMFSRNHLISAATGDPIMLPSQDMVLGCYYLTTEVKSKYLSAYRSKLTYNVNILEHYKKNTQLIAASSKISFLQKENRSEQFLQKTDLKKRIFNELSLTIFNTFSHQKSLNKNDKQGVLTPQNYNKTFYFNSFEQVMKAYQLHKVILHSNIWVKWENEVESTQAKSSFIKTYPVEIRVHLDGYWQEIRQKQLRRFDRQNNQTVQYIKTTPGRIILYNVIQDCIK